MSTDLPPKTGREAGSDLGSEAEQLIKLLLTCGTCLQREINRKFETNGLKLQQFFVLNEIVNQGPISQKELARALLMEKSNISKIVQLLFQKKLIRVTPHPIDRRATLLIETPDGSSVWQSCIEAFQIASRTLTVSLERDETRQSIGLLKKLILTLRAGGTFE